MTTALGEAPRYRYGDRVELTAGPLAVMRENDLVPDFTVPVGTMGTYIAAMPDRDDLPPDWHLIGVTINAEDLTVPAPGSAFRRASS